MATSVAFTTADKSAPIPASGLMFATLTFLTWGMAGVWVRLLHYPALFVSGLRMSVALLGLAPVILFSAARRRAVWSSMRLVDSWILAGALTAYYLLAVVGFQFGSVAEVSLFIGSSPAFALLTKKMRGLAIERREKVGAGLAAVGVLIVLGPKILAGSHGFSAGAVAGDLIGLVGAAVSAFYAGRFRQLHEEGRPTPDSMAVAALCFVFGGFSLIGVNQLAQPVDFATLLAPHNLWVALTFGLISTALPSICYAQAAKRLPAVVATTSQLMIPVVGAVGAAILLRESPSFWLLPGGALIVYGILHMFRQDSAAAESPVTDGEETLAD